MACPSLKCYVSLTELEKAAQAPAETEVELQKNVVQPHWREFAIRDAIWHVWDAWKEVMESCICGAWKKLYLEFAVDFRGFDLSKKLSEERLKCLELAKKVSLDELEDEDIDSLLETIGGELLTEDLDELEKQWCQLEKERPAAPSTMRHLTMKGLQRSFAILNQAMDHLAEIVPDIDQSKL